MTEIEDTNTVGLKAPWEVSERLHEAFLTAYIITRSEIVAEQLVCLAIELLEPAQVHSSALVVETLKLSAEFTRDKRNPGRTGNPSLALGDELAALMELEPAMRYSYVARVLLGYPLADCVELLQTDAVTITRNLLVAMRCLCERPRGHGSISQFLEFFSIAGEPQTTHSSSARFAELPNTLFPGAMENHW